MHCKDRVHTSKRQQGLPEGCECRTPSLDSLVDSEAVLSPELWRLCHLFSIFAFGELSNLDPRSLTFRFSLTTPTAAAFMGGGVGDGLNASACAQLGLAANPMAGADTWQPIIGGSPHACRGAEAAPQT